MIPTTSFSKYCKESAENNKVTIAQCFEGDFNIIRKIIDTQCDIYQQYFWVFELHGLVKLKPEHRILATAFYKNLISFNSAIELSLSGFYGSSRMILRNIYEFLLISKYIGISNDSELYQLWENGQNISVQKAVFKKIDLKDKEVLKAFWSDLCKYSHSMIYSQQIEILLSKGSLYQIKLTIIYLRILLECNYHLLNNYSLTSSIKYYANTYGDLSGVSELKSNAKKLLSSNRDKLDAYPKKIINSYKSKWNKI